MNVDGWLEIGLTLLLALAAGWPLGAYLAQVWSGGPTWLDPALAPLERLFYRVAGIDPRRKQDSLRYSLSLISFNAVGFVFLDTILRLQEFLPLNPSGAHAMSPGLAFNTAVSFVTNTDWQAYSGERQASHLAQMAGFTTQNFASAGTGMAVAAAVSRAFATSRDRTIGNFWQDFARNTLYVLLPLSIVVGLLLAALGVPQTLSPHVLARTMEGARQMIALGPVASQQSISQLGANGAGYFLAGAAHPFENPNALSNLLQMIAMIAPAVGCIVAFGRIVGNPGEARALVAVVAIFLCTASGLIYGFETRPTPALAAVSVASVPNMEGKETRFGAASSALFAALTTGSSTGATNSRHESLTPGSGGVAIFLMEIGEIMPGGAGAGLYGMLTMTLLAVFVSGLLVGRTPEYLGKKVETREIRLAMLSIICLSASTLGLAAVAAVLPSAIKSVSSSGPHGLMEILYATASSVGNNGSSFGGLAADTPFWNVALGIAMVTGRYGCALTVLAIAGGIAAKPKMPPTEGTIPTDRPLFIGLLASVILIMAGLQYFPSLALGPILEALQMHALTSR